MKVCTYKRQTPLGVFHRLGVFVSEEKIIDVNLIWQKQYELSGIFSPKIKANEMIPSSLSQLLTSYQDSTTSLLLETIDLFKSLDKKGITTTNDQAELSFNLEKTPEVSLASPIDKINCYRDFYAHEKHVKKGFEKRGEEIPAAWFEMPAYYKGPTSGFIGPEETIPWPSYSNKLDYELEFGIVIAKDGKNIKAEKALEHIFGYTVFNDISARDIQKKEMSVRLGPAKGKDFCSVVGPVILTADEFSGKEPNLNMSAKINGELWSQGLTGDSYFTWAQMIEHASKEEWLLATDFMGSGTVGTGCGLELDKWIQPGDILELEIESIGVLKNTIGYPDKI